MAGRWNVAFVATLLLLASGVYGTDPEPDSDSEPEPEVTEEPLPQLAVTTIVASPFTEVEDGEFVGFIPDLLAEVAERAGFTYVSHLVADAKYGTQDGEQWTGLIGEVIREEADLAAAALSVTSIRETVVQFTHPFMDTSITAIVRKDSGIDSVEELAENEDFTFGVIDQGSTYQSFRSSQDPLFNGMFNRMESNENSTVENTQDGVQRAEDGDFAFLTELPSAEYLVTKHCDLKVIPGFKPSNTTKGYAFALRLDDERLESINQAILDLKEDGTIDQLYKKWWSEGTTCGSSHLVASFSALLALVAATIFIHL